MLNMAIDENNALFRAISRFCFKSDEDFSDTKLYTLINASPMMAYILDIDGNFILGNNRAKEFFTTGADIMPSGRYIKFDINSVKSDITKENKQVIALDKVIDIEKQLPTQNGEKYWYRFRKTPVKDKDGNIYAILTFAGNIEKEKCLDKQRETYIATLKHDLKTPALAQIRALELLLSGQLGDFNEKQKEMLNLTLDSCKYMYNMVYTLLSTYKLENGELHLHRSDFDLSALVSDCVKELSGLSTECRTDIVFENEPCIVYADKTELKRVILCLLSNALNYAYSSTKIYISISKSCENIELKIDISGEYIEIDAIEQLFEKYVTNSEKYNKVGVGLGLYLSRKIIEAHNGKIIAQSSTDNRNTFGFKIPAYYPVEKTELYNFCV